MVLNLRPLTILIVAAHTLVTLSLSACGGGSTSGTTAPSGLSYSTPQGFTVGQAITPLSPTVSGTVTSYSVSPSLPAGLSINSSSGVISGTPTAVTAAAAYTVTASNSAGSTAAAVTISINDVKPQQVGYSSAVVAMALGLPITPLVPTATGGGAVTSWSISPALPAGLTFSTTDGTITGTPTVAQVSSNYTITATNSGGSATFAMALSVQQSATLLDLGHVNPISVLRFDGTKVLSADNQGHWVLWNYAAGTPIASGDSGCSTAASPFPCRSGVLADFAGSVFAVLTHTGFEVRSAADGHVVTTITSTLGSSTAPEYWQLARDGSYLVVTDTATLQAWSTTDGATLVSRKGSYPFNGVYAAPGQIQAVRISGGQGVIETTSVSTGTSTDSPVFNGAFQTWFADGNRFLTAAGGSVLTYSAAAVQQDITTTPAAKVLGTGNWLGTFDGSNLNIYKVGASSSPAATYPLSADAPASASGSMFIVLSGQGAVIIDLSGATPVRTDASAPISQTIAFAGVSPTEWLLGNSYGVIFDGASGLTTPRYFGYGQVWSIAGTPTRFAISTASGRIVHYASNTNTLEGTLQGFSSKLVLSADGTELAALDDTAFGGPGTSALSAKVFTLPGGGVLSTWPGTALTGPTDIDLSADGTVLGLVYNNSGGMGESYAASTYPVTGGAATWTQNCAALYLSSNASKVACAGVTARRPEEHPTFNEFATNLYNNGTLVTALNAVAVGWLDDGHLLVNNYADNAGQVTFQGVSIVGPTGTVLSTPALPEMLEPQPVTASSVYNPTTNEILSVTDGHVIWLSPDAVNQIRGPVPSPAAVAGNYVVFASGHEVVALTH